MALVGLVRCTSVGRLLGVSKEMVVRLAERLGMPIIKASTIGTPGRTGDRTTSPRFLSLENAVALCEAMLPKMANRLAAQRARRQLNRLELDVRRTTANVRHEVVAENQGGTGADEPSTETRPTPPPDKIPIPNL